jgi:hypothetical protein
MLSGQLAHLAGCESMLSGQLAHLAGCESELSDERSEEGGLLGVAGPS